MPYRLSSVVRALPRARRLLGAFLAAALTLILVPLGQPAAHAVTAVSPGTAPFGPQAVLPQWYSDATGLRLQPCQLAVGPCLVVPGLPGGPANFVPLNGEVFYWVAQSNLNTAGHGGVATPSLLMMGVEGAWVPTPGPNVFNRVRFRVGVPQTGTYTVTYPYGTKTFDVGALTPQNQGKDINDTTDSGAFATAAAPANFALATGPCPAGGCVTGGTGGPFEPFLQWDATAPAAPAGFLSDGVTPHGLTGSPTGNNFFRVEGPGINPNPADAATACPGTLAGANCVQTNLFVLNAQLATLLGATPTTP